MVLVVGSDAQEVAAETLAIGSELQKQRREAATEKLLDRRYAFGSRWRVRLPVVRNDSIEPGDQIVHEVQRLNYSKPRSLRLD
jgi:hypothetical protein